MLTCSFDLAEAMSHEHHSDDVVSPFEGKRHFLTTVNFKGTRLKTLVHTY
jgi:hypothetical protein